MATDAEVFGGKALSDADVFGPTSTEDSFGTKARLVGQDVARRAGDVLQLPAAVGDMILGAPANIVGRVKGAGAAINEFLQGGKRSDMEAADTAARNLGVFESFKTPFQSAVKSLTGAEHYDQRIVEEAFTAASEAVAKKSGGVLTAHGVEMLLGSTLDALGVKGISPTVKAARARAIESAAKRDLAKRPPPEGALTDAEVFAEPKPDLSSIPEPVEVTPKVLKEIFAKAKDPVNAVDNLFAAAREGRFPLKPLEEPKPGDVGAEAGKVTKTKLPDESIIIGDSATTGMRKIILGEEPTLTAEERIALQDVIKPRQLVDSSGKPFARGQEGMSDARMAALLAGLGLGTTAGLLGFRKFFPEEFEEVRARIRRATGMDAETKPLPSEIKKNDRDWKNWNDRFPIEGPDGVPVAGAEDFLGPLAVGMAVKGKGGMWHPEAVTRLTNPLREKLSVMGLGPDAPIAEARNEASAAWSDRAVRNYLNKHAGTETDPLKDVEVPFGEGVKRWEELTDQIIVGKSSERFPVEGAKAGETVWDAKQGYSAGELAANEPGVAHRTAAYNAIQAQLSHVGDYLRQNVAPEKLAQYDLVRAVKETAKNDERVAKEMERAAGDSTKQLPVYKEYPDGFKWVELKLPEKLTPEQARGVRPLTAEEWGDLHKWSDLRKAIKEHPELYVEALNKGEVPYKAIDKSGKAIQNSYTQEHAIGKTPEEAYLAGRLAEEGNALGHCVGGYCDSVASGESKIYSLRDAKGKSHVTVEVDENPRTAADAQNPDYLSSIVQIKGKQNRAPVAAYLPYVQDFVRNAPSTPPKRMLRVGLGKGYEFQADWIERALERHGLPKDLPVEDFDMRSYPEKGDVIDAIQPGDLVVGQHLAFKAKSTEPDYFYNKRNQDLLKTAHAKGADVLLMGEQPDGTQNPKGVLYKAPPLPAKWGEVGDLEGTGLRLTDKGYQTAAEIAQESGVRPGQVDAELARRAGASLRNEMRRAGNLDGPMEPEGPQGQRGSADLRLTAAIAAAGGLAAYFAANPEEADSLKYGAMLGAAGLGGKLKSGAGKFAGGLDYALGALSTRLGNISPALRLRAREYERRVMETTENTLTKVTPMLAILKDTKEGSRLDMALLNGDDATIKAEMSSRPNGAAAWKAMQEVLDSFEQTHKSLGRFREGITTYFPRIVKDLEGLKQTLGQEQKTSLEEALTKAEAKMIKERGRGLTEVETSIIVNNSLQAKPPGSHLPGYAHGRKVEVVTPELRPFYESPVDSFLRYSSAAIQDIEMAKFFGKDLATKKLGSKVMTDTDASIGNIVRQEQEAGNMEYKQANELRTLLKARFEGGEKTPNAAVQDIRNATNIALLGQFGSAATQIGDSMMTVYHHGLMPTLKAVKGKLTGDSQVTTREFGLVNHIAEELGSNRWTGKALQAVFKASGFSAIDQFAKGLNLNAGLLKNQSLAQTAAGRAKLAQKWGQAFGEEFPQLLDDLANKRVTDSVKSLLFSELSDAQPITKAEMPQAYLEHPNGRAMYQMKTYMLKQMDVIRRDAYEQIRDGNYVAGAKNLVAVASALALSNIPGDVIKNWISGRDADLDKIDYVENLLRNFGVSRYSMDQAGAGKPLEVGRDMVLPPYKHYQELYNALKPGATDREERKGVKYVPLVGRAVYDRELGGNEARIRAERLRERIRLRDELESQNPELRQRRLERKARREAKMRGVQ